MTIIAGITLYLVLLAIATLFGRFMKECDSSMIGSSEK